MRIGIKISFFQKLDPQVNHTPRAVDAVGYNLTEELVRRGNEVTVFATKDSETSAHIASGAFDPDDEEIKVCYEYSVGLRDKDESVNRDNRATFLKYIREGYLNIVSQADNFDLIHTHDWNVENSVAPYVKDITVPVLTTLHGANMKYGKPPGNHFFVAISQAQKKLYPALSIVGVAYNGIKIDDFEYSNEPKDYVAYLGRITPEKGTLEAIEAAKRSGHKLIIAGALDQNDSAYVGKVLAEVESSNGKVVYIGTVGQAEKNSLLKNAFVFLMPIQWEEPFGLASVEAMACGTPVIAFRRGSLPEIVKDGVNGFLVDNLDQMCEAIGKVGTIERRKCRKYVEEHFTVSQMTDAYEKIYQQVVGDHGGSSKLTG